MFLKPLQYNPDVIKFNYINWDQSQVIYCYIECNAVDSNPHLPLGLTEKSIHHNKLNPVRDCQRRYDVNPDAVNF